jgi:hypothetical protein
MQNLSRRITEKQTIKMTGYIAVQRKMLVVAKLNVRDVLYN